MAARLDAASGHPRPHLEADRRALAGLAGREVYVVEAGDLEAYLVEVWGYVGELEAAPVWVEEVVR